VTVTILNQTYQTSYEHLGIYIDPEPVIADIFYPNRLAWPRNIIAMAKQFFSPRSVEVPLSFSQEFYDYVRKIDNDDAGNHDIVYLDQDNKQVTIYALQNRYRVDTDAFQQALVKQFGTATAVIAPLTALPDPLNDTVTSTNAKLNAVYGTSLTVIVGINGTNQFLSLSPDNLRRYSTASISATNDQVTFSMNKSLLLPDLSGALSTFQSTFNSQHAYERIAGGIENALMTRFEGGPADTVKVGIDSGPNTEGGIADKYIEVDISQQKLFTFAKGKLIKTYRVSTGKDYPTPVGSFTILNKTGLGYSSIYNVWMPYWMGFAFSKELHAYFGIHELPYFYTGSQKVQRPREFIGAPNTGGCVALDVGDAKEVYQFADIGTPVVIYD
jgi:lipoprotein-anchoring transpeptidase ErfK/SrfK